MRYGRSKPPTGARLDRGHPLAQGLVFCVPCNEGGGLPRDVAGGVVPTYGGSSPWSVGPLGSAATNASTVPAYQYGNVRAVLGASVTTLAAWVIPATTARCDWLYPAGNAPNRHATLLSGVTTAGHPWFDCSSDGTANTSVEGASTLVVGALNLLVGTYDGAALRVYLNGVLDGSAAKTGALNASATTLTLLSGPSVAANGSLVCAYIWNRPLGAGEVQWLYAEPFCMFRPAPPPALRRTARFEGCALSAALAPSGGMTRSAGRTLAGSLAPTGGLGAADLLYLQRAFATRRTRALLSPQTAVTLRSGDVSVPFLFDLSAALGTADSISSATVSIYAYPHPATASVPAGTDVTASVLRSSSIVAGSGVLLLLGNANAVPGTRYRAIIVATCASGEHIQESIEHIICDQ